MSKNGSGWSSEGKSGVARLMTWMPVFGVAAAAGHRAAAVGSKRESPKTALCRPVPLSRLPLLRRAEEDADASFYPLPEAEALPAVENAMVVRVQLPVSSLQLMGVPVGEERADASVQADLLLGQDGLARGVRLAQ